MVEHDACGAEFQRLHLGIEHLGDALGRGNVGGLAAATLAKELGAVDGFVDGLAEPRSATIQAMSLCQRELPAPRRRGP